MRGIFYNSRMSLCSIWESGKMCYDALKKSTQFTLDYSEGTTLDSSYDFVIVNYHHHVNHWINESILQAFHKPTFCVVTEVSFSENPIQCVPPYFSHYLVLDSTVKETDRVHPFGRPLEDFTVTPTEHDPECPSVFSFGFATSGKEWHKIIELVQQEYDRASIHFNIPQGTYIPNSMQKNHMDAIKEECARVLTKPGIELTITHDNLSKEELIQLCSTKTINCFYYNRQHLFTSGLAAVTDQAIASGRPLFVTSDCTFRHIHQHLPFYPNLTIKEAIESTKDGVLAMKELWSSANFLAKFETILFQI